MITRSHLDQLKDILTQIEGKPEHADGAKILTAIVRKHELIASLDETSRIAREMGKAHLVESRIRQLKAEVWAEDTDDHEPQQ